MSRLSVVLGGAICSTLLVQNTALFVCFYVVTCLIRLHEFAALFTATVSVRGRLGSNYNDNNKYNNYKYNRKYNNGTYNHINDEHMINKTNSKHHE